MPESPLGILVSETATNNKMGRKNEQKQNAQKQDNTMSRLRSCDAGDSDRIRLH
jgi:hypothetical protein